MKALNMHIVSRSLPSDKELLLELRKHVILKAFSINAPYTEDDAYLDIYKYALKKAQTPSENG